MEEFVKRIIAGVQSIAPSSLYNASFNTEAALEAAELLVPPIDHNIQMHLLDSATDIRISQAEIDFEPYL